MDAQGDPPPSGARHPRRTGNNNGRRRAPSPPEHQDPQSSPSEHGGPPARRRRRRRSQSGSQSGESDGRAPRASEDAGRLRRPQPVQASLPRGRPDGRFMPRPPQQQLTPHWSGENAAQPWPAPLGEDGRRPSGSRDNPGRRPSLEEWAPQQHGGAYPYDPCPSDPADTLGAQMQRRRVQEYWWHQQQLQQQQQHQQHQLRQQHLDAMQRPPPQYTDDPHHLQHVEDPRFENRRRRFLSPMHASRDMPQPDAYHHAAYSNPPVARLERRLPGAQRHRGANGANVGSAGTRVSSDSSAHHDVGTSVTDTMTPRSDLPNTPQYANDHNHPALHGIPLERQNSGASSGRISLIDLPHDVARIALPPPPHDRANDAHHRYSGHALHFGGPFQPSPVDPHYHYPPAPPPAGYDPRTPWPGHAYGEAGFAPTPGRDPCAPPPPRPQPGPSAPTGSSRQRSGVKKVKSGGASKSKKRKRQRNWNQIDWARYPFNKQVAELVHVRVIKPEERNMILEQRCRNHDTYEQLSKSFACNNRTIQSIWKRYVEVYDEQFYNGPQPSNSAVDEDEEPRPKPEAAPRDSDGRPASKSDKDSADGDEDDTDDGGEGPSGTA